MGSLLDLADAFLADPQVPADLTKRLLGDTADPVAVDDDPALAPFSRPRSRSTTALYASCASSCSYRSLSESSLARESWCSSTDRLRRRRSFRSCRVNSLMIAQVAYVLNRLPRAKSNRSAACIKAKVPSLIRSGRS